jgi:AcrR family transcriptional regulator
MVAGARTRLETDERRAQLVEVGLRLFGTRPYDEVSMDDVAREAGVSHGLVYHYFSDKRRLYIAVLRWVADEMLAATVADPSKPALERLYDGLRAHLAFAERYAPGYTALVSGGNGNDDEVRALCEHARWQGLEEITRSLGIEEPSPSLRVALRGWAGFQEGAIVEWLKRRDLDREELLDLLAQALVSILDVIEAL